MKNLTTLLAIAAFAGCILAPLEADASPEGHTETVRFADLNPGNAKDTAVLYNRIVVAAHNVCRDLDVGGSLPAKGRYSGCWHMAANDAVAKINRTTLKEYAAARGIGPVEAGIQIARSN
jgi:UrcA family protein